ncbi:MAG: SCP2 sterol-binding domain-containing protein [Chloroflexi bacterium]|nr:SCP2 sterol-binding domain-containing protein [Chloroflexota bacterium]
MPIPFPSDAWIKALQEILNSDDEYGKIASNWEGDLTFVVEAEGARAKPIYMYMDLWRGKCREARQVADLNEKKAAFLLAAPFSVFQRIVQGKLDPMQAMMTRQLKVTGNMVYMMRNVPTVLRFVKCTEKIDSEFAA